MLRYVFAIAVAMGLTALPTATSTAGAKSRRVVPDPGLPSVKAPTTFRKAPDVIPFLPVGETPAFSRTVAEAVDKAAPIPNADLSVLRVTSRKEGAKTILTAMVQCDPLRGFAGARTLAFSRSFLRLPTNPDATSGGGAPFSEILARFSLSRLRPGEVKFFEMDATGFPGEEIVISLSPGDGNRSNDVAKVKVPAR